MKDYDEGYPELTKEQYATIKFWLVFAVVVIGYVIIAKTVGLTKFLHDDGEVLNFATLASPLGAGFISHKLIDRFWGI